MQNHALKEKRVHGNAAYPVSVYTELCNEGEPLLPCHWHSEMEFLLVTKGSAIFQVGENEYAVGEGEFIFVNSEELHAGHSVFKGAVGFSAVVFDGAFLLSAGPDAVQEKYIAPLLGRLCMPPECYRDHQWWQNDIADRLQDIVRLNRARGEACELLTKMHLYAILATLYQCCKEMKPQQMASPVSMKMARLKTVLNYIHEQYRERITLEDMAGRMAMSTGYFCRFFKSIMRKSPFEYLNGLRVNRAALLLDSGTMKISEIAEATGFENFSYFTEVFKKIMRCTPSEYRNRGQAAGDQTGVLPNH